MIKGKKVLRFRLYEGQYLIPWGSFNASVNFVSGGHDLNEKIEKLYS